MNRKKQANCGPRVLGRSWRRGPPTRHIQWVPKGQCLCDGWNLDQAKHNAEDLQGRGWKLVSPDLVRAEAARSGRLLGHGDKHGAGFRECSHGRVKGDGRGFDVDFAIAILLGVLDFEVVEVNVGHGDGGVGVLEVEISAVVSVEHVSERESMVFGHVSSDAFFGSFFRHCARYQAVSRDGGVGRLLLLV